MSHGLGGRTIGIGSMVVDRLHRAPQIARADEKVTLQGLSGAAAVERLPGGVVLNHLGWAAALGLPVGIVGLLPDDADGQLLRAAMAALGIASQLEPRGSETAVSEIFVDAAGERAIYMAPGANAELRPEHVRAHFAAALQAAARVTTEVSQLPLDSVLEVLRIAGQADVPSVLDVDVPPDVATATLGSAQQLEAALRAATQLKVAGAAARALAPEAGDDALALARALRARFANAAVLVTDGARGCAVACREGALRVAAPALASGRVVDATGAGDAFLGGWLAAQGAGLGLEQAAALACAAGAACTQQVGAFPHDAEQAREAVRMHHPQGALPAAPAAPAAADAAAARSAGAARGPAAAAREALGAFGVAVEELEALRGRLAPEAFEAALRLVRAARVRAGRVHVTGVGKPEHVARYAAALLSSTGTPATFLHATECVHGSAGQVLPGDVVVAISNSGRTAELLAALDAARAQGAASIAITGDRRAPLAARADVVLDAGVAREGGGLGLAPRASAAAQLLVVAALSAALEVAEGLDPERYRAWHPAGTLGGRE